jgi:hypothetical protein
MPMIATTIMSSISVKPLTSAAFGVNCVLIVPVRPCARTCLTQRASGGQSKSYATSKNRAESRGYGEFMYCDVTKNVTSTDAAARRRRYVR